MDLMAYLLNAYLASGEVDAAVKPTLDAFCDFGMKHLGGNPPTSLGYFDDTSLSARLNDGTVVRLSPQLAAPDQNFSIPVIGGMGGSPTLQSPTIKM